IWLQGKNPKLFQARAPVVTELSTSTLKTLRRDGELVLYRSRIKSHKSRFLLVESVTDPPSPCSLKRLEHEYSLSGELDLGWAARPVALPYQGPAHETGLPLEHGLRSSNLETEVRTIR